MTDENGLKLHGALAKKLLLAGEHYKQEGHIPKLMAFTSVVAAFNEYARATNAPTDVCFMLSDMMGEFANLGEGRPTNIIKPQKTKNSPRTSVLYEGLWAAAAVYIDCNGVSDEVCARAEEKLRYAGCPLPRNSTHGTEDPGASIKNWRKRKRSARRSKMLDQLFQDYRDVIDQRVRETGTPLEKVAEFIMDKAVENFRISLKVP